MTRSIARSALPRSSVTELWKIKRRQGVSSFFFFIIVTFFILSYFVGLEGPDHCLVTVLLLASVLLHAVDEEAEADPAVDVPLVGPLDSVRYLKEFKLQFFD